LAFLPFFHVYMMMGMIFALIGGMQIVSLPRYTAKDVLRCIEKYRASELLYSNTDYILF